MMVPSSNDRPVRLALLGAGTFAVSTHFPILSSLQKANRVKINLIWSRRLSSASTLAKKYGTDVAIAHSEHISSNASDGSDSSELKSALDALGQHRDNLDAVILCVPIPQNTMYARAALSVGLHVLCEKPLAHDIPSAISLLQYHRELKLSTAPTPLFGIAENFRFEHAFLLAQSKLSSVCGKVLSLNLHAQTPMPAGSRYAFGWRLQLPGAGILMDGFVHAVAGLRLLAGADVATVSANCMSNGSHFEGCDTAVAHMTFDTESKLVGSVFVSFATAVFHWELTASGERGDIVLRRERGKPGYRLITRNATEQLSDEFVPFCGIDREFDAFVTSCQSGTLDKGLSPHDAFNDMATVHSMYESSQSGHVMTVPKPS